MSDELAGLVDRVTYHDQQSGYTVAKLFVEGQEELVTVVGHFNQLAAGEALRLEGRWTQHPTHGAQFKVAHYRVERPATLVGMEKYLGSGMIKGVGPKMATLLNDRGITRFDQISKLSDGQVEALDSSLGAFRGRFTRDRIVEQAHYLARGDTGAAQLEPFQEEFPA